MFSNTVWHGPAAASKVKKNSIRLGNKNVLQHRLALEHCCSLTQTVDIVQPFVFPIKVLMQRTWTDNIKRQKDNYSFFPTAPQNAQYPSNLNTEHNFGLSFSSTVLLVTAVRHHIITVSHCRQRQSCVDSAFLVLTPKEISKHGINHMQTRLPDMFRLLVSNPSKSRTQSLHCSVLMQVNKHRLSETRESKTNPVLIAHWLIAHFSLSCSLFITLSHDQN